MSKNAEIPDYCDESPPPEQRLLSSSQFDEKVPDVVTTNGQMPVEKRNYQPVFRHIFNISI